MAIDVSAIVAEVTKAKGLSASVKVFIAELRSALAAELANDPATQATVDALVVDLASHNQELSDAMAANPTPVP